MKTTVSFLVFIGLLFVVTQAKLIPTPFGLRPEICVTRGVPSGSRIEEVEDGVKITHPDGNIHKLEKHQECIDFHNDWMEKRNATKSPRPKVGSPLDGWLDYAGYYPPSTDQVYSFQGNYYVPPNPANNGGQVLFYFIGTENFQSNVGLTILQPVLTWGNGLNGWSFASWNCCPAGQQQESTPFQGFGAGDTVQGYIDQSGSNWVVTSSWNGQSTTLTVPSASRDFNWVDVTLETYSVGSCDQFPDGPMVFSSMLLTIDNAGAVSPQWQADTGGTECGGTLSIQSPSQITIQHY